ncbi:hypothetical protein C3L33_13513, partial [Rhododendron williamsianum]
MVMLIRGVLRSLKIRTPSPSYYSSFSPSSSTTKSDAGIVSAGAAADVAAEDLLLDDDLPASAAAAAATLPSLLQPRVVVYDGVCHLCHNGVKWVIKADQDRKIKFCCLQSQAAEPYMRICGVDREDVLRRFLSRCILEIVATLVGHMRHMSEEANMRCTESIVLLALPYSALSTLLIVPTPLRDAAYDYLPRGAMTGLERRTIAWF